MSAAFLKETGSSFQILDSAMENLDKSLFRISEELKVSEFKI